METLKETLKASTQVLYEVPPLAREKRDPERKRQQEIFAWIAIAAIWATFAFSLFIIWTRASDGI